MDGPSSFRDSRDSRDSVRTLLAVNYLTRVDGEDNVIICIYVYILYELDGDIKQRITELCGGF